MVEAARLNRPAAAVLGAKLESAGLGHLADPKERGAGREAWRSDERHPRRKRRGTARNPRHRRGRARLPADRLTGSLRGHRDGWG